VVNTTRDAALSAASGRIALRIAIRLLVVSGSESQKSRRTQPRSGWKNSTRPAAPPGRALSLNWFPRHDSSA
jgi:hypothetical protein